MEETKEMLSAEVSAGDATETMPVMEPLKQTRKHFSRLGLFFFLGSVIATIVQTVPAVLISFLNPDILDNSNAVLLLALVPLYLFGMPALIALVKIVPASPVERHSMKGGHFTVAALMAFAIMYSSNLIGVMLTTAIGLLKKGGGVENTLLGLVDSLNVPLMFVCMVICAPVIEEYVFRKLIVERTVRYGQGVAVVLSGLMFGLFHGNFNQFIYAFTLGMFLAFLYVKTGKLKITIAIHAIVNFMGSIVATTMLDMVNLDEYLGMLEGGFNYDAYMAYMRDNVLGFLLYFTYIFCLIGVVIAGGILIIIALAKSKVRFAPGEVVIPKGKRFRTVILNLGILLYCVFWIAMIIYQLAI